MLPTGPTPTILIAGFGSIGRRHFRNLRELGCERFVFLRTRRGSIDDEEIAAWPSVQTIEEALAHRPSMAVIANPSALHLPVAMAAAEAGCSLFIEKPVSDTLRPLRSAAGLGEEKTSHHDDRLPVPLSSAVDRPASGD